MKKPITSLMVTMALCLFAACSGSDDEPEARPTPTSSDGDAAADVVKGPHTCQSLWDAFEVGGCFREGCEYWVLLPECSGWNSFLECAGDNIVATCGDDGPHIVGCDEQFQALQICGGSGCHDGDLFGCTCPDDSHGTSYCTEEGEIGPCVCD